MAQMAAYERADIQFADLAAKFFLMVSVFLAIGFGCPFIATIIENQPFSSLGEIIFFLPFSLLLFLGYCFCRVPKALLAEANAPYN